MALAVCVLNEEVGASLSDGVHTLLGSFLGFPLPGKTSQALPD